MPIPQKPLLICNYLSTAAQSATHLLRLLHQRVRDILRLVRKAKSQVVKDDHSIVLAQLVWKQNRSDWRLILVCGPTYDPVVVVAGGGEAVDQDQGLGAGALGKTKI